jgi:ABC-2 type transport system ATP-binding protein
LSTHILPEVEQICQQVIIISKGKLVATDTVDNLQNRASGAESVLLEVAGRKGELDTTVVQARIGKVPGVNRIVLKQKQPTHSTFEVETQKDRFVRGDLARAIVEAGWDLNEMRSAAVSLEEVFLQLTGTQESAPKEEVVVAGAGK